jgi:hypothetical protein
VPLREQLDEAELVKAKEVSTRVWQPEENGSYVFALVP